MPRILISYRREDTTAITGRIYDFLCTRFGATNVFMDIDSIPPGADFRDAIARAVAQCDVVLVVIGDHWLAADAQGRPRLDEPTDFVRNELESALKAGKIVIPVLVGAAPVPKPASLPASLQDLCYRNGVPLDMGIDFHVHMERLVSGIESACANRKTAVPPVPKPNVESQVPRSGRSMARTVGTFIAVIGLILIAMWIFRPHPHRTTQPANPPVEKDQRAPAKKTKPEPPTKSFVQKPPQAYVRTYPSAKDTNAMK